MGRWTDLLAVHSAAGWWGGEASAPQGMGWLTNQLAAFPSMHAGWALWVALAVAHVVRRRSVDRPRLDARGADRRGRGRHRQPLGPRRGRRLGGRPHRLADRRPNGG